MEYNEYTIKLNLLRSTIQCLKNIHKAVQRSLLSNSTFSSWKKETPYPLALTPHPLAISFVSTHWPSTDISYIWNHTYGLCFWLLSLSKMFSRFSHWITYINVSFLLMVEFYSTVCIYQTYSSIHSLVDGHVGCF